jgi:AraC-like DNA-binding protein
MNFSVLQLITLFSGFLLVVLGSLFLFNRIKNQQSNQLLGSFLISNAILLFNFFLFQTIKEYHSLYPVIHIVGTYSYLLLAPLLYLYITSLCNYSYRMPLKGFLHFIPFVIFIFLGILIDVFKKEVALRIDDIDLLLYSFFKLVLYIQLVVYIYASFAELHKYRVQLNEMFSSLIKIDLQWVNLILYFLILMGSTDLVIFLTQRFHLTGFFVEHFLIHQTIAINLILCVCLIYKGMRHSNVPAGKLPIPKYLQHSGDVTSYGELQKQLSAVMETQKPYLQPELNLEELAKQLNCTPRILSQMIHVCYDQNFNNHINQYRVEEAKRIIRDDTGNKKSVFEVQCDAGFNSKSTFNLSFKKYTGLTPKEYRINGKS